MLRRIPAALGGLALTAVLAACGSGAGASPSGPPPSVDPNAVVVSATELKFDQTSLAVPAGAPFTIAFDNTRGTAPHNVAFQTPAGQKTFEGDLIDGGKTTTYSVPAMAAGSYTFLCTLHPDMKGPATAS
jgi:plastocyanin